MCIIGFILQIQMGDAYDVNVSNSMSRNQGMFAWEELN